MGGSAEFMQLAGDHWRKRGGRMTAVREMICRAITESDDAFLADELWVQTRKIDPGISQGSVYRTLRDLVEIGMLHEVHGPEKHRCFIRSHAASASRVLVICNDCRRVFPLDDAAATRRLLDAVGDLGLDQRPLQLSIHTSCAALQESGLKTEGFAAACTPHALDSALA